MYGVLLYTDGSVLRSRHDSLVVYHMACGQMLRCDPYYLVSLCGGEVLPDLQNCLFSSMHRDTQALPSANQAPLTVPVQRTGAAAAPGEQDGSKSALPGTTCSFTRTENFREGRRHED